ncbi:glycine--tRNA ligase subunit beta [Crocosphaera chwakensis]|uniref:Glycine--tRNA ligase beta subunit n=1 Tax=Crocosphaera chwakensis CCY0110 TaxID=391612 RepID=A3INN8_9CHRO|nr:glycine--tRNA ligase subunit beta [Crocosphaera chwakensis]EAZ91936.1 glycyl-tRNA synthetase subunit beta [Crocosphaera chwakensis CCY0110]
MFFLLEVGTEELPADFIDEAIAQWKQIIPNSLEENFLTPDKVAVYGTPRRLAVLISELPEQQKDRDEVIKGPPAKAAFKDGKPTKAAEGFARKQEVEIKDLDIRPTDKGDFIFIEKKIKGRQTKEILQALIPNWIDSLEGRRFMRWGNGELRFSRPIRWLVALCDKQVLPIEIINGDSTITSDRLSRGHRILHPDTVSIAQASDYVETLRSAYVEVDPKQRQEIIEKDIETIAKELKGKADLPDDLLTEVINLIEYPTAIAGKFDPEFLNLPTEVITTVMVKHQRYFAVKKTENELLPNFITIANGDPNKKDIIAQGNERVIRARLADAQFFYTADCDEPLDSYLPELENVTFQKELGTMRDKVDRIMDMAQQIAKQLEIDEKEQEEIESTALLCKADLVTQMVYEFPELQGVMGQKYALVSGESEQVAQGIFDHYLPRGANDIMPKTLTGQVVGIADRLDTLISIFGLGMIPTGSGDPFALRRAANAIISVTWEAKLPINLSQLLIQGCEAFMADHADKDSPLEALQTFLIQRIQTLLQDELNIDYDLVNAVLGEADAEYTDRALQNLLDVKDRAEFLQEIRNNEILDKIYETVNRSTRLAAKGDLNYTELDPSEVVQTELFEKSSEQEFYNGLMALLSKTTQAQSQRNYQLLIEGLLDIVPKVSEFFDGENSVLVMDENPQVRQNRLNLLGVLRNHGRVLADFGAIVKS